MTETVRVLHVDDEPDFAEMAATFLEREDDRFVVETATRAEEGSEMLDGDGDGYEYDCVVSDYDMPGKNGVEFLKSVREEYPELPFILFTGKGSEEVASEAISAGATDYLQKESGTEQYTVLANRIENVVEKYRSERAAERNRERLSMFFEQSPVGAIQWDEEFRFERLNGMAEEILGYTEEELRGEAWEKIVHEADTEDVGEKVESLLDADGGIYSVNKNVRKDGEVIVCEWHNRAVTDEDGSVRSVFSKFQDITQRREREEELQRYETIIEALNDGVYVLDEQGRFVYANEAFVGMVGYDEDELLDNTPSLIKSEEAVETAESELGRLLSDEGPDSTTFEVEIHPKSGETIPCEDHMGVLPYEGDEFEGSVGVLRDISDLRDREERLESHREYTDSILDASDDLFFVCDEGGALQRWNDRLNEVAGYSDEEVASMNALDFVPEEHRERSGEKMAEVFEEGSARLEAPVLTEEGSAVPYEFTTNCVEHPDGEPRLVAIGRDVTERKEHEKKLERQNERLDEFASVVSHDLRSPLSVAKGRLKLAQDKCDNEHLDRVEEAHDRMEALIGNVLSIARNEKAADSTESVELGGFVEECWQKMETEGAVLVTDFRGATTVQADRGRLRQLLENLMRNAVEHGSTGNQTQSGDAVEHGSTGEHDDGGVTVTVGELGDGGFYVADDGPGISEEERESVFESGYSTSGEGTGLGLSIVRDIAEARGWEVSVTESEGGGARFEVTGVE